MTISSATRRTEGNANHPAYVVGQGLQIVEWLQQNQAFSIIESQGPLGSMMRASVHDAPWTSCFHLPGSFRQADGDERFKSWYVPWALGRTVPSRTPQGEFILLDAEILGSGENGIRRARYCCRNCSNIPTD